MMTRTDTRSTRRFRTGIYAAIIAASFVPCSLHNAHAATFGLDYWPSGYECDALFNRNWTSAQPAVARDIDQMASLSVGVVRLMFWPELSGYNTIANGGGGQFTTDYNEVVTNLPTLVSLFQARGIRVIIAFSNSYLDLSRTGFVTWQSAYGNTSQGFTNFEIDSEKWLHGIVNKIETGPYAPNVLYYDYQNEIRNDPTYLPNGWLYVNYMYDHSPVPAGKRGVSVLTVPGDDDQLKSQLGSRVLQFVDFHSYPANSPPVNANIESDYEHVKGLFPSAVVLLGEFGQRANPGVQSEESAQESTDLNVINRAIAKGIPYYLNWTLWDNPNYQGEIFGFASTSAVPKDVLGGVSARLNIVSNPDMETPVGGVPSGWAAGGTIPVTFVDVANASDAATNQYFARLQVNNQTSGGAWVIAPNVVVQGKSRLYVDFYFRSTMTSVHVDVHEYNASGAELRVSHGPGYTLSTWAWNNYLQRVGTWSQPLLSTTYSVTVAIAGSLNASNPAYLDVDTLSAYAR